jgi:hypothetical protein
MGTRASGAPRPLSRKAAKTVSRRYLLKDKRKHCITTCTTPLHFSFFRRFSRTQLCSSQRKDPRYLQSLARFFLRGIKSACSFTAYPI